MKKWWKKRVSPAQGSGGDGNNGDAVYKTTVVVSRSQHGYILGDSCFAAVHTK